MIARRSWLVFVVLALLVLGLLAHAGLRDRTYRTYALDAQNETQVAVVPAGGSVCEGPVPGSPAVGGVWIFAGSIGPGSIAGVTVRRAGATTVLASGYGRLNGPGLYRISLNRTVPAGPPVSVCISNVGPPPLSVLGQPPVQPAVVAVQGRKQLNSQFSLVLVSAARPSELSLLGTAFARAALWRPSWVGAWTFWVLLAGLLGTIVFGAVAIAGASREDAQPPRPREDAQPSRSPADGGAVGGARPPSDAAATPQP